MSEWKEYNLEDVSNILIGGTPSRSISYYWANENENGYKWVAISDLSVKKFISDTSEKVTENGYKASNTKLLPIGTVIFSFKLTLGKKAITKVEVLTNEAIAGFITNKKLIDDEFLYYYLEVIDYSKVIDTAVKGITLNKQKLRILKLTIPNLPIQYKIAKILSNSDAVIEITQAAIDKYKAIKQGMLHDLFTRGIDISTGKLRPKYEDAPELYKESKLGWIPKDWEVENFQNATEIITDFTANGSFESLRLNVKYYYEPNYGRLIRLTDLRVKLQNDGVYVDKEGFDFLSKSELKENDIMLANVGEYTGFACLMPKVNYPATIAPNMFLTRCNAEIFNPQYMYYFMILDTFTRQVDNACGSSATKLLNKTNFRAMSILKPSIKEQELIGIKLKKIDDNIEIEQSYLNKVQMQKTGLMGDLLSGRKSVTVKEEEMA